MTTTTYRHGRPEDTRARRRTARVRGALVVLLLALAAGAWAVLGIDRAPDGVGGAPGLVPGTVPAAAAQDETAAAGTTPATGLDPELERRFAAARAAAAADGVDLTLTSGWRTVEEQQRLVDQAVERYGTPEAYRWVLPPEHSAHVQGLAVDVGPTDGALWLGEHGLEHGLCRTYLNEVWHFEMLPDGATSCPEPHADSSWGW